MNHRPQFKKNKIILTANSGYKYNFYFINTEKKPSPKLLSQIKNGYKFLIDTKNNKLVFIKPLAGEKSHPEEHKISSLLLDSKIPAQCSPRDSLQVKTKLFSNCNNILESLGLFPSRQEMEFNLYNLSTYWLLLA